MAYGSVRSLCVDSKLRCNDRGEMKANKVGKKHRKSFLNLNLLQKLSKTLLFYFPIDRAFSASGNFYLEFRLSTRKNSLLHLVS